MKKFLSGLLSAALAASLLAPSAAAAGTGFTDVPAGSSLAGEVEKAVDCGLMNGYDAGTFGYGDSMTRAQFVTALGRLFGWESEICRARAGESGLSREAEEFLRHPSYGDGGMAAAVRIVSETGGK